MTSADLIAELRSARPTADHALRERVRAIAATEPAPRRPSPFAWLGRLSPRRVALVALPATAVVLLGVAGGAALLDSGGPATRESTPAQESYSAAAGTAPPAGGDALSAQAPKAKLAPGVAADATAPAPTTGRAQRYSAQ